MLNLRPLMKNMEIPIKTAYLNLMRNEIAAEVIREKISPHDKNNMPCGEPQSPPPAIALHEAELLPREGAAYGG